MAWEAEALKLLITPPEGGTREAAALCQSVTWGGSYDQAARTLDFPLLVCPEDKRLPTVDCPPGSRVQFYRGRRCSSGRLCVLPAAGHAVQHGGGVLCGPGAVLKAEPGGLPLPRPDP